MHKLSEKISFIRRTIYSCCKRLGGDIFFHGNGVLYEIFGDNNFLRDFTIEALIPSEINADDLYGCLKERIKISREIENSPEIYHFVSEGYEVVLHFKHGLDPRNAANATKLANTSLDLNFYSPESQSFFNPLEENTEVATSLRCLKDEFEFRDILSFIKYAGTSNEITFDPDQLKHLKDVSMFSFKDPVYTTWEDIIEQILLLPQPGVAVKFISQAFLDGAPWLFNSLADYMIYVNVPMNEDVTIDSVFEEKKLSLIDVYNDFFLSGQAFKETSDEVHKRLTTTLKLLFDSPNLKIPKAHISRVRVMAGGELGRCCLGAGATGTIHTVACGYPIEEEDCRALPIFCNQPGGECLEEHPAFNSTDFNTIPTPSHRSWCANKICPPEGNVDCVDQGQGEIPDCFGAFPCDCSSEPPPPSDYCPGGDCFTCTPTECAGPQCCCCSSVDIVFSVRARCHDRVFISCALDGESAGGCVDNCDPPEISEPFPVGCPQCREACDFALGEGENTCADISGHGGSPAPSWWGFPGKGPCTCFDQLRQNGPPIRCVTCRDLKCKGSIDVTSSNCNYQMTITPSTACCGTPAIVDVVFLIDASGSMQRTITNTKNDVGILADAIAVTGAEPRFALIIYGQNGRGDEDKASGDISRPEGGPKLILDFTTDVSEFKDAVNDISLGLGPEPCFDAVEFAINHLNIIGIKTLFFLIGDEPVENGGPITRLGDPFGQPTRFELTQLCNSLGITVITIQPKFGFNQPPRAWDRDKQNLATTTGGTRFDIAEPFGDAIEELDLDVFPASCDCLDFTPIPLFFCAGGQAANGDCLTPTRNIPIEICVDENNADCDCNEDFVFDVCGEIVLIEPLSDTINLQCCGDINDGIGGGCNCPAELCPDAGCCGLCDHDIRDFESLEAAKQILWCECFEAAKAGEGGLFFDDNVLCGGDCIEAPFDCAIKVPNGFCDFDLFTREEVEKEIEDEWEDIIIGGEDIPPSLSEETCKPDCNRLDQTITVDECSSLRNPSVAILNNGVGLVAYESLEDNNSVIRISQFRTSVPAKILPNRPSNKGRLEHFSKWIDDSVVGKVAKLYYFEPLPAHFMNGIQTVVDPDAEDLVTDIIVFRNGPFQNQCFPLYQTATLGPVGSDDIGNFVIFTVGDTGVSNPFPSTDDVYNIEWFLIDRDDAGDNSDAASTGGLTGSTTVATAPDIPQPDLLADVTGPGGVNELLSLGVHTHNGKAVPVANPSIAAAHNYSNVNENSHFVYVVYQALEDEKWNLYLRQLRLSEYSRDVQFQIIAGEEVSLESLNVSELIYRVVCVNDECEDFGNDFLLSRSIVMEVFTQDRREVLNRGFLGQTTQWSGLCSGSTDTFLQKKVYAKFTHSVVANQCANQFGFNEIFYNWNPGDEFVIPFAPIAARSMFLLLKKEDDNAIDLGSTPIAAGGVNITQSQAGAVWFDAQEVSTWVTVDLAALNTLQSYKGLDRADPVPITEFETGHCTHPVIKLNSNNDLFVTYECTDTEVQQIHLLGTAVPISSLPLGIFVPKNLDASLDYFLTLDDFTYNQDITTALQGINQMPDMFIDLNDVIHLAWQSNRDNYWEIYYATLTNNFVNKRITDSKSKSLKPSITGDDRGNTHIAWHDDRFGNWEILMAYQDGERIPPLAEQDPYMASARNKTIGYEHHIDTAPLTLQNTTNDVICINSLFVTFYEDRLLTKRAFDILQSDWPFAFEVPSIQTDRTSSFVYPAFGDWEISVAGSFDFPLPFEILLTTQEFDSEISSEIEKIVAAIDVLQISSLYISFRASDIANDSNSESQWTSWSELLKHWPDDESGIITRTVNYRDLTLFNIITGQDTQARLERVFGRYKQIRINTDDSDFVSNNLSSLVVHSVSGRLCLPPGDTTTAHLDLTPEIRVDKEGNQVSEIPLPLKIDKNQTYFIAVSAFTDTGFIRFDDQLRSISCETCSRSVSSWDSTSCSIFRNLNNEASVSMFFNVRFRFFTDPTLKNLIAQFETFSASDLKCFTVAEDTPAQDVWAQAGYELLPGISRRLTLWPLLSNTTGLLCGVTYWVESTICMSDGVDTPDGCTRLDLAIPLLTEWDCKCESARWDDRFEDAPVNIRQTVRWSSSGDGFSDTRLTETKIGSTVNNFNPTIRIRNDLTGIVVYESNRTDFDKDSNICPSGPEIYRIYASAFSVFPNDPMYASGAESVRSLNALLIKSDIPIVTCDGVDCDDSLIQTDGTPPQLNPQFENQCALEGRNPAMALDQYNNIFTAFEALNDQTKCEEFTRNTGRKITVHTCGANARNLSFNLGETATTEGAVICTSEEILDKTAPITEDKIMKKIIQAVRVKNENVSYHITRNKKPAAVVERCSIILEVVVEPDVVAVRARNEDLSSWSTWYPFDPEIGDYTMQIPWELSVSSGIKTVTIQAATYQGLSVTFSVTIIADYKGVEHTIRFFKSTDVDPPAFGDDSTPTLSQFGNQDQIAKLFDSDEPGTEELPNLEGVPIAGLRPPSLTVEEPISIETKVGEFIFIQFDPSSSYLSQFTAAELILPENAPTFDVLQQGQEDKFTLNTVYHPDSESFRGVISIKRDDKSLHQDGLAFIIPHFTRDCGDISVKLTSSEQHRPDRFNIMASREQIEGGEIPTDIFASERDQVGRVEHKITIRPLEDPYFIFGDPNYRLKKENE